MQGTIPIKLGWCLPILTFMVRGSTVVNTGDERSF